MKIDSDSESGLLEFGRLVIERLGRMTVRSGGRGEGMWFVPGSIRSAGLESGSISKCQGRRTHGADDAFQLSSALTDRVHL